MKVYIVGEYREQFCSRLSNLHFNPHPSYSNIEDILQACKDKGIDCQYYGGVLNLIHDIDACTQFDDDALFLNISDGLTQPYCRLQAPVLFELLDVKYTGSTPFTVALMNNKHYSKMAVLNAKIENVCIPDGFLLTKQICLNTEHYADLEYPQIIKPNNDGFSMGISDKSVVHSPDSAKKQIKLLFRDYNEIIIEKYIPGMDVSVFLLGNSDKIDINEVIVYKTYGQFYLKDKVRGIDVKAKKTSKKMAGTEVLDSKLILKLKKISKDIFCLFNTRDIARIDYRITNTGKIYFIEINASPVLSKTSDAAIVCESANITYSELIEKYIQIAHKRY